MSLRVYSLCMSCVFQLLYIYIYIFFKFMLLGSGAT